MSAHTRSIAIAVVLIAGVGSPGFADIAFEDVSETAGLDREGETYGAAWGDLDGDGYPDLFVSMHRTRPALYLNRRDGTFVDVSLQTSIWTDRQPNADTHGGTWFDFDNDGDQDLFVPLGRGNPAQFLRNERGALINLAQASHDQSCAEIDEGPPIDGTGSGPDNVLVDPCWEGRLASWLDYDQDGRPDFVLPQGSGRTPLMRQREGGGFSDENDATGFGCPPGQYVQLLDVTGDGRLELICPNGQSTEYPFRIWEPLPDRWRLVQGESGEGTQIMPSFTPVADSVIADFDNDGLMDVFLLSGAQVRQSDAALGANGRTIEARLMGGTKGFSFVADGSVTFELHQVGFGSAPAYVGAQATPVGSTFTLDPGSNSVVGMPDLAAELPILGIGFDPETRRWTVTQRARADESEGGGDEGVRSVWAETYLLISSTVPIDDLETSGLWPSDGASAPTLLMNRTADGLGFVDETADRGLDEAVQCVSATAGDFNNDMHIDLYLACRTATSNIANVLYENRGDGTFVRLPDAGNAAGPIGTAVGEGAGTADTVVAADYDLDGFLDLFVTNGLNMFPEGQGGALRLYRNLGNDNNWVQLDLVGTGSHREAVGAVVIATAEGVDQFRVKNGSYHRWAHDHTRMHFGLARAETVDLHIVWPSGAEERHEGLPVNRVYRATEDGGIAAVDPEEALPYPCGLPPEFGTLGGEALNAAVGGGIFLGKDCRNGTWQLRATRGVDVDEAPVYAGAIVSGEPMPRVRLRNLQQSDSVACDGAECEAGEFHEATQDPVITDGVTELEFELRLFGGVRGIDFNPAAATCITINAPPGTPVRIGPFMEPVSSQFEIETLEPCDGQPPPPPPPLSDDDDGNGDPDGGDDGNGGNDGPDGGNDDDDGEAPPSDTQGDDGGSGALGLGSLALLLALAGWRRAARPRRIISPRMTARAG